MTPTPSLNHLSFNQNSEIFSASTSSGYRIYYCHPFQEICRMNFHDGGIRITEMLFLPKTLALVGFGGGEGVYEPRLPPNKILICDENELFKSELVFDSDVRSVRLRKDRIIAVLDNRVIMYSFEDLRPLGDIETAPNPKGLCAVTQDMGLFVLVSPGTKKGQVRVEHCTDQRLGLDMARTRMIMAHDSPLACIALSQNGLLLATASSKGTLVRIFSTVDGTLRHEVRRGSDRADIYCLAFSNDMRWLAVSSNKETIHVFSLNIDLGSIKKDSPCPALEASNSSSYL